MPAPYSVTLHVNLHRQDKDDLCGAACIQMLREFDGEPLASLDQERLRTAALATPFLPAECSRSESWSLCPSALEGGLTGMIHGDYLQMSTSSQESVVTNVIHSITNFRKPAVVLVDRGGHWLVFHGVRSDGTDHYIFDIRDPWPPRSVSAPAHDVLVDCGAEENAASSHLLFPAGLAYRFESASVRSNQGEESRWNRLFVGVVPLPSIINPPAAYLPPPILPAPLAAVTQPDAEAEAIRAFSRASALGWPPAVGEKIVVGRAEMIAADEPHSTLAKQAEASYIVELHRDGNPGHVVAMVLVAAYGEFAGQALEMLAPAGSKSWLRQVAETQALLQESVQKLQRSVGGELMEAELTGQALAAWPRDKNNVPESMRWLLDEPLEGVELKYAWSSSRDTRSPFHPHIRVQKGDKTVLLMPNGRLRAAKAKMVNADNKPVEAQEANS